MFEWFLIVFFGFFIFTEYVIILLHKRSVGISASIDSKSLGIAKTGIIPSQLHNGAQQAIKELKNHII